MTVRKYLSQLQVLDLKINIMLNEVKALREMVTGRGIAYDKDRVQSSPQNTQEQYIVKWVDLEGRIDREIAQRSRIINEIQANKLSFTINFLYHVKIYRKMTGGPYYTTDIPLPPRMVSILLFP